MHLTTFRQYAASVKRPFEVHYDPFTQTIRKLNTTQAIVDLARTTHADLTCLQNAIKRLNGIGH